VKCAVHPRRDAIAICRICGTGVCNECHQKIGGISYCQSCIDQGRYRLPIQTTAPTHGPPQASQGFFTPIMRYTFLIGIIAMALLSLGFYLLFYGLLFTIPFYNPLNTIRTIAILLITISITLCGIPFYSYWRAFNSKLALGVALFSFYAGWPYFISNLLLYTGLVYPSEFYPWELGPGPLFFIYAILGLIGFTLLGITFILWSVVLVRNRHYLQSQNLVLAASIFFVMLGHLILFLVPFLVEFSMNPYLYMGLTTYVELILMFVAEAAAVFTAIGFYHLRKQVQMVIISKIPTTHS
jgi:hypothetical protein